MTDHPDDDEFYSQEDLDAIDDLEDELAPTPLVEATTALHEVYTALIEGGFGEYDALRLVAYMISEQGLAE